MPFGPDSNHAESLRLAFSDRAEDSHTLMEKCVDKGFADSLLLVLMEALPLGREQAGPWIAVIREMHPDLEVGSMSLV